VSKVTTALHGMRLLDGGIKIFAIAHGTPL
jgi:hypothetical protein